MKKVALYSGSFNPWHKGHQQIVDKALQFFDKVYVIQAQNSEKDWLDWTKPAEFDCNPDVELRTCAEGLLKDFINKIIINSRDEFVLIKGLRNTIDFEYEKSMQYLNEDLGLKIPVFYIIADRSTTHISSSAVRAITKAGGKL